MDQHQLTQHAVDAIPGTKTIATASITTAGVGLSTLFDWLSAGVGLVASIAGVILCGMLIYKVRLEHKKLNLEIKTLRRRSTDAK